MLYAHSFSEIELNLYRQLSQQEEIHQIDCTLIRDKESLQRVISYDKQKTLLYWQHRERKGKSGTIFRPAALPTSCLPDVSRPHC